MGGNVAAHRACDNDGVGAHVLAGDASCLADDEHTAQGNLALERAFNADAARAVDRTMPDDSRTKHRGYPLHGLYGL
jgi:hypothetical protein